MTLEEHAYAYGMYASAGWDELASAYAEHFVSEYAEDLTTATSHANIYPRFAEQWIAEALAEDVA